MGKKYTYKYVKEEFNKEGYKLLSKEYINCETKMQTICPYGHTWETTFSNFHNNGGRCSKCSGREATSETCIATTDPWMMKFLKNKEDGYKYTHCSSKKIDVVCPNCGKQKKMIIANIYKYKGIGCEICNDGISYSEKFIISLLNQLEIEYIKEYKPEWSNNKRYDFYLPNYNCIIECHGEQHYSNNNNFSTCGGRTLEEEQENDKLKEKIALQNGINNYIILNCMKNNLGWIKGSIISSELNNLLDLSNIDWLKCEEFTTTNIIKEVCNYWHLHNDINNEDLSTLYLSKTFSLDKTTIIKYLKKGTKLGLCSYNPKKEQLKGKSKAGKASGKSVEIFKDNKSLGIFPSCIELEKRSEELFGVKLLSAYIGRVCRGKYKQYKGFTFRFITKEECEKRKQIKNNN